MDLRHRNFVKGQESGTLLSAAIVTCKESEKGNDMWFKFNKISGFVQLNLVFQEKREKFN